ncbi:MAG: DNA/RNA non-specific endonuclease [Prevotellaceae bacterium]|nr:DNA/RNA non-specific endonuclease [Prevotellaceae bacterium]
MRRKHASRLWPLLLVCVIAAALQQRQAPQAAANGSTADSAAVHAASGSGRSGSDAPCAPLADRPERILRHGRYIVSYNAQTACPNYVGWWLTAAQTSGHVSRDGADFLPDPLLGPAEQITTDDYRGSGFDRGHMCPAADNRYDGRAMTECFYMSNICPQDHALNAGAWATLENACRRWAVQEDSVLIVCGPMFAAEAPVIGRRHRVSVPRGFFKCVLSLRAGAEKAIGFVYANTAERQSMEHAARTVDEVERLTGIDFFAHLPDELEQRIEASCSLKAWH